MARSPRTPRRLSAREYCLSLQHLSSINRRQAASLHKEHQHNKPPIKSSSSNAMKEDWKDATCSVCMEYPHNAVLLLCSSHNKGCRPYMCGTSFLYSNCLDQYKKAYTKLPAPETPTPAASEKPGVAELSCPLCRGQVKGWTVVERARSCLNSKKRTCMQDNCSYVGTYKELRRHMKTAHPRAKPREVDPLMEQRWRRLEREREHEDVLSVIRSSTPGAVVWGDYVIEGGPHNDGGFIDDDNFVEGGGGRDGVDPSILYVLSLFRAFENSNASLASRLRRVERGPPRAGSDGDGEERRQLYGHHERETGTVERRRRRRRRSRSYTRHGLDVDGS